MKKEKADKKNNFCAGLLIVCIFLVFQFIILPYSESENVGKEAAVPVFPSEEIEELKVAKASEYLILVNKSHKIDPEYVPSDLVMLKHVAEDRPPKYQKMRKVAADAFEHLAKDAQKDGCKLRATSAFRPYKYQEKLHKAYEQTDSSQKVEQYSAKPGYSEHETGLAVDVSAESVGYELVEELEDTKEGKWIVKNAHKYGFILRYPKGKKSITGYMYEPWHLRYVGEDVAKKIYEEKVTLEEYLDETE